MTELYTSLTGTQMRTIRMVAPPFVGGGRLGGKPPAGVRPRIITGKTKYFLTLPVSDEWSVSVFISLDYEDRGSEEFFGSRNRYCLHGEDHHCAQFVIHESHLPVGGDDSFVGYDALGLKQGEVSYDADVKVVADFSAGGIYDDHKTGGAPYFDQLEGPIMQQSLDALASGYRHMLQLLFPGNLDAEFHGDWPFGETVFHVFGKPGQKKNEWSFLYGWG